MYINKIAECASNSTPKLHGNIQAIYLLNALTKHLIVNDQQLIQQYIESQHPTHRHRAKDALHTTDVLVRSAKEHQCLKSAESYLFSLIDHNTSLTSDHIIATFNLLHGQNYDAPHDLASYPTIKVRKLSTEEILYEGAAPEIRQACIDTILEHFNHNPCQLPYPLLAATIHMQCIHAHVFPDGNGRMARLLADACLRKHEVYFSHSALSHYYVWDRAKYDATTRLNGCFSDDIIRSIPSLTKWYAYFLDSLTKGLQYELRARFICKILEYKSRLFNTPINRHTIVTPVPANTPLEIDKGLLRRYGHVLNAWPYKDREGNILFYFLRFSGHQKKIPRKPYCYLQYYSDRKWRANRPYFTDGFPLYRLDLLPTGPACYLICEGEKATDAAVKLCEGTNIHPTTWSGGAFHVGGTDWRHICHHQNTVYFWRDNDSSGLHAQESIAAKILPHVHQLYVLHPDALANKPATWDVADAVSEGMTQADFLEFIHKHMVLYSPSET